jgi:phosphoribosylanthranilate isomerase
MSLLIKICGLTDTASAEATARAGADMGGFMFFEKSPRHLGDLATAQEIAAALGDVTRVAVTVDADDAALEAIVGAIAPQILQLHGTESVERVTELKSRFGLKVMKVCSISDAGDVEAARLYDGAADLLLFDAKPPKSGASRPGGLGQVFDWSLLAGTQWQVPWLLAGGLDPSNVAAAIGAAHPNGVDVSSGVETSPGVKSPELIERFVAAARNA